MERFNFKDIKAITKRLVACHKAQKNYSKLKIQEAKSKGIIEPILSAFDIRKVKRALQRKVDKYYSNTPKYKPHQGKQECARRVRQMQRNGVL